MSEQILIVEDEIKLANLMSDFLCILSKPVKMQYAQNKRELPL